MKRVPLIFLFILFYLLVYGLRNPQDLSFTLEEEQWLEENKHNLRFAPNPNWIPGDYIDSEGVHHGIAADLVKIIENKLNISFNRVYFNTWTEMLSGIENSEADFMASIQMTSERERLMNFTDSYMKVYNKCRI